MDTTEIVQVTRKCFKGENPLFKYSFNDGEGFLIYVVRGKGKAILNKVKYPLLPGTVVFCREKGTLAFRFSKNTEIEYFSAEIKFADDNFPPKESFVCRFRNDDIKPIWDNFFKAFIHKRKYHPCHLYSAFCMFICNVMPPIPADDTTMREISLLAEEIHNNFLSDIDVKKYSDKTGLSKDRFSVIFKNNYSLPPYKYQLMLKMEEATNLLTHTDLSVGEISKMLGFSSPLYFSSAYKKQIGMAPTEVRKRGSH